MLQSSCPNCCGSLAVLLYSACCRLVSHITWYMSLPVIAEALLPFSLHPLMWSGMLSYSAAMWYFGCLDVLLVVLVNMYPCLTLFFFASVLLFVGMSNKSAADSSGSKSGFLSGGASSSELYDYSVCMFLPFSWGLKLGRRVICQSGWCITHVSSHSAPTGLSG